MNGKSAEEHFESECIMCGETGCSNPSHISPSVAEEIIEIAPLLNPQAELKRAVLMLFTEDELIDELNRRHTL